MRSLCLCDDNGCVPIYENSALFLYPLQKGTFGYGMSLWNNFFFVILPSINANCIHLMS